MTIVVDTLTPHSKSPPPCPIRRSPPPPPPPGHHNPSPLHPLTPGPSHSMTNKGLFKMLRILKERVVRWLVRELVPSCLVSRHSDSRHLSAGICQPASVSRHLSAGIYQPAFWQPASVSRHLSAGILTVGICQPASVSRHCKFVINNVHSNLATTSIF